MLHEALLFAAFYAVALVALVAHGLVARHVVLSADAAARAHRRAVLAAALAKAGSTALEHYVFHAAEALAHVLGH